MKFENDSSFVKGLGDKQTRNLPTLLMRDPHIYSLSGNRNCKITKESVSSVSLLHEHLSTINTTKLVSLSTVKCSPNTEMIIYEPILKILIPKLEDSFFSVLTSQTCCNILSKYMQSFIFEPEGLDLFELCELLHFSFISGKFNSLKTKIGLQMEEILPKTDKTVLAECVRRMHETGFVEMRNWLIFSLMNRSPTEFEMQQFNFSYDLLLQFPLCNSDRHLQTIFSDVLSSAENSIELNVKDSVPFPLVMEKLWKSREESGDFFVKSEKDGLSVKYHKAILTCLPFFRAQAESEMKRGSEGHTTFLSSSCFEKYMKHLYLGETFQFEAPDVIELLNKENGICFYNFGKEDQLILFFHQKLKESINNQTCISVLIESARGGMEDLIESCCNLISNNTQILEEMDELSTEEQITVLRLVNKFLLDQSKQLKSTNESLLRRLNTEK